MSALNIVMERDRVHLFTDGATYDLEGVVRVIGSKVVRSEALGVAIGYSGRTDTASIVAELRSLGPTTVAELTGVLPALAAGLKRPNTAAHPEDEAGGDNDVQLAVLFYDQAAHRPRAVLISTRTAWMGESFPVLQPVEVKGIIVPQVDTAAVLGAPHRPLRPDDDGRALLELQRRTPWRLPGGDQWCVGGFGERHTVSAGGIERAELVRWPDRVGEVIWPG